MVVPASIIICLIFHSFTASVLSFGAQNSCSPRSGENCRRCDCVPDCMDLSDEKNCSYGSIDDFFLSLNNMMKIQDATEQHCGSSEKFFPPPPLPPFSMCEQPVTTPTAAPTRPSSPVTTFTAQPTRPSSPTTNTPSTRPCYKKTTTAVPTRAPTPVPTPVPTTGTTPRPRTTMFPYINAWNYCRQLYASYQQALLCANWIFNCLLRPTSCQPLTTITTTTPSIVQPDYYPDYYYNYNNNYYNNYYF